MLKFIITASALVVAAPAIAQTAQDQQQSAPKTATSAPATVSTPVQDSTITPTSEPAATRPATVAAEADPAATATAQPATGDTVAQVVDSGWSTYDANGDGKLNESEFAAWMNKVRADSDPKLDPASPAARKWNEGAFAQADTNKNKTLSKAELTAFLSKGQKAS